MICNIYKFSKVWFLTCRSETKYRKTNLFRTVNFTQKSVPKHAYYFFHITYDYRDTNLGHPVQTYIRGLSKAAWVKSQQKRIINIIAKSTVKHPQERLYWICSKHNPNSLSPASMCSCKRTSSDRLGFLYPVRKWHVPDTWAGNSLGRHSRSLASKSNPAVSIRRLELTVRH